MTNYRIVKEVTESIEYLEYMIVSHKFFSGKKIINWIKVPKAYLDVDYYSSLRGEYVKFEDKVINSNNTDLKKFIIDYPNISFYLKKYKKQQDELNSKWKKRQNILNNKMSEESIESWNNYYKSYSRAKNRIEQVQQDKEPKV